MHLWQLCHLAMVVPIADAYYELDDPEKVEKEWKRAAKNYIGIFCLAGSQSGRRDERTYADLSCDR